MSGKKAKHPGWVFVDRDGYAWGWTEDVPGLAPEATAIRPFMTHAEAVSAVRQCRYSSWPEVREWRPTDLVPPMPEGMEGVAPVVWLDQSRLIAAAPDMLEALVMIRDADEDCRKDGLPTLPPLARFKIDRALAKAEGVP